MGPDDNITKEELTPKTKIVVKNGFQINSLITSKNHLLVGGYGEIYAYSWKSIKGRNHTFITVEHKFYYREYNKQVVVVTKFVFYA